MNVLVTGGAGFIGSHLVDRLVGKGHQVTVIDNESTGLRENVHPAAHYVEGDVTSTEDLEAAFAPGIDAVCHIAGQVSLIRSFTDPVIDLRTNVEGTLNVLQACLLYRVPRLLYASSMTVYGPDSVLPTPEDSPCEPISYYGVTKCAAERFVRATADRHDIGFRFDVTCFRMYNVYGPRQSLENPYQGVLGIFIGNLLREEPITIFGDGDQSRDFVYIDDIVDAWEGALQNPASFGGVFNLGSGRQIAIRTLAEHVMRAFGRTRGDYPVVHEPARPGEQRHVEADIRRARAVLNWAPRVTFEVGLSETVRWAQRQNAHVRSHARG